ncbi:MAG TPA: DUF47 family protein [Candidatus Polarisedimenticolia bacterium]|nr:DUF47 family protein [Candidatus Polarisedimenticolia bacterium]
MLSVKRTDKLFFDTFDAMAAGAAEAALILEEMFRNSVGAYAAQATRIKEIEHRCDKHVHELVRTLHRTFITPIDREDIHDLGSSMDDVVDLIDAAASRAVLFRIESEIPDAADLARIIHKQAEEIRQAVMHLRDSNKTLDRCARINELEKEGDRLYREAVVRVFDSGKDPIFVIKAKEIIETLEAATDAAESVAIVLERIVLKNQ